MNEMINKVFKRPLRKSYYKIGEWEVCMILTEKRTVFTLSTIGCCHGEMIYAVLDSNLGIPFRRQLGKKIDILSNIVNSYDGTNTVSKEREDSCFDDFDKKFFENLQD